jgi:hypothetical protein
VGALQAAFPNGVCDYTKPDPNRMDTVPWLTYQNADGSVVYGGKPLGEPPVSTPLRSARPGAGAGADAAG